MQRKMEPIHKAPCMFPKSAMKSLTQEPHEFGQRMGASDVGTGSQDKALPLPWEFSQT